MTLRLLAAILDRLARTAAPSLSLDGFSDDASEWMEELHERA